MSKLSSHGSNGGRPKSDLFPRGRGTEMRYAALWLLGIPLPVVILLAIFKVI
jgi:hypothetical protein